MAIIWILIFIIHEYLKENKTKKYIEIIIFGLLYSLSIGMISWWLQHFLDSPMRSLRIIPLWYFLSYLIYSAHMKTTNRLKTLNIAVLWAIVIWWLSFIAYKFLPASWYSGIDWDHHGEGNTMQWMNCNKWDVSCVDKMKNQNGMMWWMMDHSMMNHANVVSEEQFVLDMIPHHQEAVDTSKEIVSRSTNAELKDLAEDIIDAQTKEIAMMKGWLKEWYPNSTWVSTYKNMMPNLTIVSGTSLDKLYLQGMMMHHGGAIAMAQWVLVLSPREEVKEFANQIIEAQSKEIEIMKWLMMATMPGMNHKMMGK